MAMTAINQDGITLVCGDTYQETVPDGCSLVLTDPPYGVTNCQWDNKQDMERLGDLLDSFIGSGSTGIACKLENRRFWGCEQETKWYNVSRKRISSTHIQPTLDRQPEPLPDMSRFN